MEYKSIGFQVTDLKASGDQWQFSGYGSTFHNIDEGNDVVLPGAFTESIKSRFELKTKPRTKLLWQHYSDEPIGLPTVLREDSRGLYAEFKLSKTARGTDAYELLKDGVLDSLSIGYIPEDQEIDKKTGVRSLKQVDLMEISIVSFPMNEEALITAVKAAVRLPLAKHVDRLLEDVRIVTDRCKDVARLRAEEQRPPGESVDRIRSELPTELKALAAEVEALLSAVPEAVPPTVEKSLGSTSTTTAMRLAIARKRREREQLMEIA